MLVTVTNSETNEPVVDALVEIRDKDGVVVLTEKTNSKGQINYRPRQETSLNIKTLKADYESSMKDYTAPSADADEVQVLLKPIEKIIVKDEVILNPILFEFDKSNITAQGAFELDKLVAVMAKYPNMVIDAGSHTDYIGRDTYNLRLSERRAQSTVQYVISKGINASRISGKGYGETQPKVLCGNKCTDEQRQINRRSEFKIVSGGPQ
jgi:outer membrane protein OmpA-like peptidoglycan-associated protein